MKQLMPNKGQLSILNRKVKDKFYEVMYATERLKEFPKEVIGHDDIVVSSTSFTDEQDEIIYRLEVMPWRIKHPYEERYINNLRFTMQFIRSPITNKLLRSNNALQTWTIDLTLIRFPVKSELFKSYPEVMKTWAQYTNLNYNLKMLELMLFISNKIYEGHDLKFSGIDL